MGGTSIWQLLIIAVIAVLLPDTKRLGSIGSDLGASTKSFKKIMGDDKPEQNKTSQDAGPIVKAIADKQTDTSREQAKTEDTRRHGKEQVQSMFNTGFSELLLVSIIGSVTLGPQRLPVAVKTVAGWTRAPCSLVITVQNELTQELKLREPQDSLKEVEKVSLTNLTPELKASTDELRQVAEPMKRFYVVNDPEKASGGTRAIHNLVVRDNETVYEGVAPTAAQTQVSSPEQRPETTPEPVVKPAADAGPKTATPPLSSSDGP